MIFTDGSRWSLAHFAVLITSVVFCKFLTISFERIVVYEAKGALEAVVFFLGNCI